MAQTKVRLTITISPSILEAGKRKAGLIPLSRWLESLVQKELAGAEEGGGKP